MTAIPVPGCGPIALSLLLGVPSRMSASLLQAQQLAIQWIGQQVQAQAAFLAYVDAFWVLMLISLAAVPLTLTLRKVKLGGPVSMGH